MKNTVRRLLALVVTAVMVFSLSGAVFAFEGQDPASRPLEAKQVISEGVQSLGSGTAVSYDLSAIRNGNTFAVTDNKADDEIAADQIVMIMVQLKDAPAMEVYDSYKAGQAYADSLVVKQAAAAESIRSALNVDVEVLYNYSVLFNGFAFEGEYRLVEELNRMEGIHAFVAAEWDTPVVNLYSSGEMVGAPEAWDLDYTGEGKAIAIIDTGLKVDHEAFANDPDQATVRFTRDDVAALIAGGQLQDSGASTMNVSNVYFSAKIPFRWNYVKHNYNVAHTTVESDHGTHVAGIAAGNGGQIQGIAKDAQIFAMNVFNDGGGAGWAAILSALEDCAVIGVDSANMSLGSPCGFTHYYDASYATTFENLVTAGVNLSGSAGNEYSTALGNAWGGGGTNMGYALNYNPDYGVTGSPSCWPRSLSVAAVANAKSEAFYIENIATGEKFAYNETEYDQPMLAAAFGGQTVDYVYVPGAGEEADFEGVDVNGKFALIQRGSISFYVKVLNAQANGAIGVIIFNNVSGSINMDLSNAQGQMTIPAVSITLAAGTPLADAGEGQIFISAEAAIIDAPGGGLPTDFSSWGTTSDLTMKPEIAAPGGAIFSSTDPSISGALYQVWDGTSMSAPHVAGGMAVVKSYVEEMFPDATAAEIRELVDAILISTADPVADSAGDLAAVRKQGSGLMDLAGATTTKAYLSVAGSARPKLEIGDDPEKTGVFEMTFTVNNFGDEDLSYSVVPYVVIDDLQGLDIDNEGNMVIGYTQTSWDITDYCDIDKPVVVTVPAHGTLDITVKITLTDDIKEYINDYYPVGCFVEGFIELYGTEGSVGDINNDGQVTMEDALLVMRIALGLVETEEPASADVNRDGKITLVDALLILRYALGVSQDFSCGELTAGVDLNIAFLGYYGDWNYAPMLDLGCYYDEYSYGSNPNGDNLIGATYGTSVYALGINPYVETEDLSYYDPARNAVSPNGDGFLDTTSFARVSLMRNAAVAGYQLLDAEGNVLADLAKGTDVRKSYYHVSDEYYSNFEVSMPAWNAEPYAGQQLYIRAYAYLDNDGRYTTEAFTADTENYFNEWIVPVYIDTAAPTAEVVSYADGVLTINVADNRFAAVAAVLEGEVVEGEFTIGSIGDVVGLFAEEAGETVAVELEGVASGSFIALGDYAGNEVLYQWNGTALVPVADSWSHAAAAMPDLDIYMNAQGITVDGETTPWIHVNSLALGDAEQTYISLRSDPNNYKCAERVGNNIYGITAEGKLTRITVSGSTWSDPVNVANVSLSNPRDMSYNPANNTMYVVDGPQNIYTIDLTTGATTFVCTARYAAIAMSFGSDGSCYTIESGGWLIRLNLETGDIDSDEDVICQGCGVAPVSEAGSYWPLQYGSTIDNWFIWVAIDSSVQSLSDYDPIHMIAINLTTGEYADMGPAHVDVTSGTLYIKPVGIFGNENTTVIPDQTVNHEDFYEDFEGAFNWTLVDADHDNNNWGVAEFDYGLFYDGPHAAVSYSWLNNILYPDNWMISPSFTVGENRYLSYFTSSANAGLFTDIDEHWQVVVIPEGSDYADGIVVQELTMSTYKLTEHVVDLSQFAGQTIRIAFRHYDCFDEYTLIIDAVAVGTRK